MIRKTLGKILTRIGKLLAGKPDDEHHDPTERWIRRLKADFKKKRNMRLDVRFNPMAIDDTCCFPVRGDPSEELAFLEWMEEKGIKLPKKDILRNDNQWHGLDINYNPMENTEDYFIPLRDVA